MVNLANTLVSFFKRQVLDYPQPETPRSSRKFVKAMKHLHVSPPRNDCLNGSDLHLQEIFPGYTNFNRQFLDLLRKIFVYDPHKRITAKEALQHPWFRERIEDDGTEAENIKAAKEAKTRYQR